MSARAWRSRPNPGSGTPRHGPGVPFVHMPAAEFQRVHDALLKGTDTALHRLHWIPTGVEYSDVTPLRRVGILFAGRPLPVPAGREYSRRRRARRKRR